MHYLGYRVLEDGRKVYCLRTQKIFSAGNVQRNVDAPPASSLTPLNWAKEAAEQALMPARLPDGVPETWGIRVKSAGPFHVQSKGYKTFLKQINSNAAGRHQEIL
jgi:hypothetical protein